MVADLRTGWPALAHAPVRRQFDQHRDRVLAEILQREAGLERAVPVTPLVLLAAHAYDVRQDAERAGWLPPRTVTGWSPDEWYGLRLLACYELASRQPRGPRRQGRQLGWSSIAGLTRGSRPC
jgi:hypothetical protein